MQKRTRQYLLAGVSCVVVGAAVFLALVPKAVSAPTPASSEDEWYAYIEARGGKNAYADFTNILKPRGSGEQHSAAHRFGGALYRAEGVEGLSACDQQFSYGCFHEFLGRAIAEHGLGAVNTLSAACASVLGTELSCQHGLGHGILAFHGYTFDNLKNALSACDTLESKTPGGCFGGVFMEYNMRIMSEEGARPIESIWGACTTLSARYDRACYYTLPQWWRAHNFNESVDYVYQVLGERCALVEEEDLRRSCFAGLGVEVITDMHGSVQRAHELCGAGVPPRDLVWCLSTATQAFSKGDERRTGVCDPLSGDAIRICRTYGNDLELVLSLQGFTVGKD